MPQLQESRLTDLVSAHFRAHTSSPRAPTGGLPTNISRTVLPSRGTTPTSPTLASSLLSKEFPLYIKGICHAIAAAHENWRRAAFLTGVLINGGVAKGGRFEGPSLSERVIGLGPKQGLGGNAMPYTRAIGDGLSLCWLNWASSVTVPNLNWYPSFVAVPASFAAPVPNVPTPLSSLSWSATALAPRTLEGMISSMLTTRGPYAAELILSVAEGFSIAVSEWLSQQLVTGVLGKGAVPAYSPPYVPVGPVVGGDNIGAPGHLIT